MTKALLESVLATLEGRSAPRDPIQVWAAAPSLSQPGLAAASPVAPLLSHTMCRDIETPLVTPLQVVDAFAVPRVQYDPVRKLFHRSSMAPQLQADAQVGEARLRQCRAVQGTVSSVHSCGGNVLTIAAVLPLLLCSAAAPPHALLSAPFAPPEQGVAVRQPLLPGVAAPQTQQALPPRPGGRQRGTGLVQLAGRVPLQAWLAPMAVAAGSAHRCTPAWLLHMHHACPKQILLQFAGLGAASGSSECELTELKAMLGVVGEQRYVAGFLTQVHTHMLIEQRQMPACIRSLVCCLALLACCRLSALRWTLTFPLQPGGAVRAVCRTTCQPPSLS